MSNTPHSSTPTTPRTATAPTTPNGTTVASPISTRSPGQRASLQFGRSFIHKNPLSYKRRPEATPIGKLLGGDTMIFSTTNSYNYHLLMIISLNNCVD